ncbi:hypothetical protein COOONC_16724 [Cooperia oncophora]
MDPRFVLILAAPLVVQLKINLTLTIAIALERMLALLFPVCYRKLPASKYAVYCLLVGSFLGTVDLVLLFALTPFKRSPQCGAFGCFISAEYRFYLGNSNMAMGIVVIILITILIIRLRFMQRQRVHNSQSWESQMFMQANRTSAGILVTSVLFVTIPSVGVGVIEVFGYSIFRAIGPFYSVGLLCAGK